MPADFLDAALPAPPSFSLARPPPRFPPQPRSLHAHQSGQRAQAGEKAFICNVVNVFIDFPQNIKFPGLSCGSCPPLWGNELPSTSAPPAREAGGAGRTLLVQGGHPGKNQATYNLPTCSRCSPGTSTSSKTRSA